MKGRLGTAGKHLMKIKAFPVALAFGFLAGITSPVFSETITLIHSNDIHGTFKPLSCLFLTERFPYVINIQKGNISESQGAFMRDAKKSVILLALSLIDWR